MGKGKTEQGSPSGSHLSPCAVPLTHAAECLQNTHWELCSALLSNSLPHRSLQSPAACWAVLDADPRQMAQAAGRTPWKAAAPLVSLRVQKPALCIVWPAHCFDCPGRLGFAGRRLLLRA